MALITELRKRSWLILSSIALALVLFLVSSALNKNTGVFNKGRTKFAEIDGMEVTPDQFEQKYQENLIGYLTQTQKLQDYQSGNYSVDRQTEFQLREQTWQDMLDETLMNEQTQKLGLTVTDEEFTNLIFGPDPHPYIKNYYIGLSKTGQYDADAFNQYVTYIKDQNNQQNNPQVQQAYFDYIMRERLAKKDYITQKYVSLFSKADYIPQWMVKRDYELRNRRVNFDFVDMPYTQIADTAVKVTDADLKTYFEKNKNKFRQKDDSRIIDYIVWEFTPTPKDSTAIMTGLVADIEKMKTAKNDSAFIATRSDDPNKVNRDYTTRTELYSTGIDSSLVDSIYMKPVGSLIGPYFNGGYYKAASIRARKNMPDSADVRHILIAINDKRDSVAAKTLADSLLTAIQAGSDFAALAKKYSDDSGSGAKGGELGWATPKTNYVKPLYDYVFETGKVGEYAIVKTEFGYHIIQIKEQKDRLDFVRVFYLSKIIEAGNSTEDSVEMIAGEYYDTHKTPETFETGAAQKGLQKITSPPINKNQFEITGLSDSREIIDWAFTAQKGEIKYFNDMPGKSVIAYLKEVRNKGVPKLEDVSDQVKQELIREKKGEMLAKKMQDAMDGGAKDLQSIAAKVNSSVKTSTNASLATPYAPGIGLEPKVVGIVLGTEEGKITKIIQGNRGVYIARVTNAVQPQETQDYTMNLNQMTYGVRNKLGQQNVIQNLNTKADVVDNRFRF